jgi:hypothetical protein
VCCVYAAVTVSASLLSLLRFTAAMGQGSGQGSVAEVKALPPPPSFVESLASAPVTAAAVTSALESQLGRDPTGLVMQYLSPQSKCLMHPVGSCVLAALCFLRPV